MSQLTRSCKVEGCPRDLFADGYCSPHYKRKWRYGDPLAGGRFHDEPEADRLARLYRVRSDGCWEWVGAIDRIGYSTVWYRGRVRRAHRVVYEVLRGAPASELDHLCRFKACVNPDHLEPVTRSENLRRHYSTITGCPQGHSYDEANTYMDGGKRRCRMCMREAQRRRRASKR